MMKAVIIFANLKAKALSFTMKFHASYRFFKNSH